MALVLALWILAEPLAVLALQAAGLGPAALHITRLGARRLEVADLTLGGGDLHAESVTADYTLGGLLRGRLARLEVSGLEVRGRLGPHPSFGALDRLRPDGAEDEDEPPPVDQLAVHQGRLRLETPLGPHAIDFEARLQGEALTIEARLDDQALTLAGTLGGDGTLTLSAPQPLALSADALPPALAAMLPVPEDTPLTLTLSGPGGGPLTATLAAGDGARVVRGDVEMGLALGEIASGKLRLLGTAELLRDGVVRRVDVDRLDLELAGELAAGRFEAGLALAGWHGAPMVADLPARLRLAVHRLRLPGATLDQADLAVQGVLRLDGRRLAFQLERPASLELAGFDAPGWVRLVRPLSLPLVPAGDGPPLLELTLTADGGATLRPHVASPGAELGLAGPGGDALTVATGAVSVDATLPLDGDEPGWRLDLTDGRVDLPGLPLAVASLSLASAAPDRLHLTAHLRPLGQPAPVVPVTLTGMLTFADQGAAIQGTVADESGQLRIELAGRAGGRDSGEVRVVMAPMEFVPGGLQPGALFPALAESGPVSGRVALAGPLRWRGGVMESGLEVLVADVSGRPGGIDLRRLNGVILLNRLLPPATPPGQELALAAADLGLPLTDIRATFRLDDGRLVIDRALARLGQAHVGLGQTTLPGPLALVVAGLETGWLAGLAGRDIAGGGRLDGILPVALGPAGARVAGGVLAADGPGTLRFQRDDAAAPDDFPYQSLTVTVDGAVGGAVTAMLRGTGDHPIGLALNLTGAFGRTVDQALAGYSIPEAIKARMSRFTAAPPDGKEDQ